jgi:hypothetical protein
LVMFSTSKRRGNMVSLPCLTGPDFDSMEIMGGTMSTSNAVF